MFRSSDNGDGQWIPIYIIGELQQIDWDRGVFIENETPIIGNGWVINRHYVQINFRHIRVLFAVTDLECEKVLAVPIFFRRITVTSFSMVYQVAVLRTIDNPGR